MFVGAAYVNRILKPRIAPIILTQATRQLSGMAASASDLTVAYITIKPELASDFASKLVSSELAACVNIIPGVASVYKWKGSIEQDAESLLIVKTRLTLKDDIVEFLRKNHPYEIPELIMLPVQAGHMPYLQWVEDNTKK